MLRRKTFSALHCCLAAVFSGLFLLDYSTHLSGQETASAAMGELQQALQRGEALERAGRWGDALTHYEEIHKFFPNNSQLERRLFVTRARFDVVRRYSDPGFLSTVDEVGDQGALDVFNEVLLKIHTHFVKAPNWQAIVQLGESNMELALTERTFIERFAPSAQRDLIENCRNELRNVAEARPVTSRLDARTAVYESAKAANDALGIPVKVTVMEYVCGAVNSLDEYSSFLSSSQLDEVFSQIEGNFVGLGVELKTQGNLLTIDDVIPGGPADLAGIRAGDRIVAVDGKRTRDVSADTAADLLRGPEGSRVSVELMDRQGQSRRLVVERRKVEIPCVVRAEVVDRDYGIGYVRLTSFQKSTSRDIDSALWKLHRDGMRSLILDLRRNPGGLLTAAVELADKFISTGTIVSTRGRNSREDADYKAHGPGTWRVPLVVLIDGDSASASEIFAAAIRDHRRGTVVGQRSYGKGSVQGIFPLNASNVGLRLTTAKFFSPNGQPISGRGVSPDIAVQVVAKPVIGDQGSVIELKTERDGEEQDSVLETAIRVAKDQITRR